MKKFTVCLPLLVFLLVSGAAAFSGQTFEINHASHVQSGSNENRVSEMFKKLVEERSKGAIVVKNFPDAVFGTEMENLGQIKSGEIEMTVLGIVGPQQMVPEYDATSLPFAFPTIEAVEEYWSGPLGVKIRELMLQRNNAVLLGLLRRGPRNLTANKAIASPSDLSGLKLRIPEVATWVTIWKSMGALPTPVNWSEVYTSLQAGIVDAHENPIETTYIGKINEVQSHLMLTEHLYLHFFYIMNNKFYENLPADYQILIVDALKEATDWGNKIGEQEEQEILKKMEKDGLTVVRVDKQMFMQAAMDGILEAANTLTPEAREVVVRLLNK